MLYNQQNVVFFFWHKVLYMFLCLIHCSQLNIFVLQTYLPNVRVHAYFAPVTPPPSVGGGRRRFCRCCAIVWSTLTGSIMASSGCNNSVHQCAVKLPDFFQPAEVRHCNDNIFLFNVCELENFICLAWMTEELQWSTSVHSEVNSTAVMSLWPQWYMFYMLQIAYQLKWKRKSAF